MALGELPEGLIPSQLSTLSNFQLGLELNKIDDSAATLTQEANAAEAALAEAEVRLLANPDDIEAKMAVKVQRAALRVANRDLSQLSKRQSRIQSIMKANGVAPSHGA